MSYYSKNWSWLLSLIPEMQQQGVLDTDNADRLSAYCRSQKEKENKYFIPALAVIGCVLIAAGIVLIFNFNWDMFSVGTRTAISFLPLLLGCILSCYTLIKDKGGIWREASALITVAGANTAAALISHIYHTGGTLEEFATLMILTTFPLLFIFNSRAMAFIFPVWLFMSVGMNNNGFKSMLLLGIYAAYLIKLMRDGGGSAVFARYMTIPAVIYSFVVFAEVFPAFLFAVTGIFFMFLAEDIYLKDKELASNPWLWCSFFVLAFLLLIGSFAGEELFECHYYPEQCAVVIYYGLLLVAAAGLLIRRICKKMCYGQLWILCAILLLVAAGGAGLELPYRLLCILLAAVWGGYLLWRGGKTKSTFIFNGGMTVVVALTVCRFFDENIGTLARALGFLIAGIAFVVANIIFAKRVKAEKMEVGHEEK